MIVGTSRYRRIGFRCTLPPITDSANETCVHGFTTRCSCHRANGLWSDLWLKAESGSSYSNTGWTDVLAANPVGIVELETHRIKLKVIRAHPMHRYALVFNKQECFIDVVRDLFVLPRDRGLTVCSSLPKRGFTDDGQVVGGYRFAFTKRSACAIRRGHLGSEFQILWAVPRL